MAKQKGEGDNLASDISKLPLQQPWDVPWFSKGEALNPYGTGPETPSDGDLADKAFEGLGRLPEDT
jgi:hypothetical protein